MSVASAYRGIIDVTSPDTIYLAIWGLSGNAPCWLPRDTTSYWHFLYYQAVCLALHYRLPVYYNLTLRINHVEWHVCVSRPDALTWRRRKLPTLVVSDGSWLAFPFRDHRHFTRVIIQCFLNAIPVHSSGNYRYFDQ